MDAVDIVINLMRKLSSKEPVMFQRDSGFYVASEQGFGMVSWGLSLRLRGKEWTGTEYAPEFPEMFESEDLIKIVKRNTRDAEMKFTKGEKYLNPILFGNDSKTFTLMNLIDSAAQLQKLRDDGNIRMVEHGSGYHSHKYGYACDGIDVWVNNARVMKRDRYLELLKEREKEICKKLRDFVEPERWSGGKDYSTMKFPDCTIITQNLMLNFPRAGCIDSFRENVWGDETTFCPKWDSFNSGDILYHRQELSTHHESPFAARLHINSQYSNITDGKQYQNFRKSFTEGLNKELDAVQEIMPVAEEYILGLNLHHNMIRVAKKDNKKVAV